MTTVTFRCDEATGRLIQTLAQEGENRSDTIRRALEDAARFRRREMMRREAAECLADADDVAEAAAVQADLGDLRAW